LFTAFSFNGRGFLVPTIQWWGKERKKERKFLSFGHNPSSRLSVNRGEKSQNGQNKQKNRKGELNKDRTLILI